MDLPLTPEPFVFAACVAVAAWAVCKEEIARELREECQRRCRDETRHVLARKFWFVWTCEYCFSFWLGLAGVVALNLLSPEPRLRVLYGHWTGYVVGHFFAWALAVAYMSLFQLVRVDIKAQRAEADRLAAGTR